MIRRYIGYTPSRFYATISTHPEVIDELAAEVKENADSFNYHYHSEPDKTVDESVFDKCPKTADEVLAKLGRKKNAWYKLIGPYVDLARHIRRAYGVSVLELSGIQLGKLLHYKRPQNNGYALRQKLEDVGLLVRCNDYFNADLGCAMKFAYNRNVEKILSGLIKESGVCYPKPDFKKLSRHFVGDEPKLADIKASIRSDADYVTKLYKVDFAKGLHIPCCNADLVLAILKAKHPCWDYIQNVIAENNDLLAKMNGKNDQLHYTMTPSVAWNKDGFLTRVGIRAYAGVCSLPKHPNEDNAMTRNEFYTDELGWKITTNANGKLLSKYDVPASIYNITRLLRKGVWYDDDLYEQIFQEHWNLANPDEKAKRANKKLLLQRPYFSTSVLVCGSRMKALAPVFSKKYYALNQSIYAPATPKRAGMVVKPKTATDLVSEYLYSRIVDVCGEPFKSAVFFYESCVYAMAFNRLLKMGVNCVQIFDCFESPDVSIVYKAPKAIKEAAYEFYKKWYKMELALTEAQKKQSIRNLLEAQYKEAFEVCI